MTAARAGAAIAGGLLAAVLLGAVAEAQPPAPLEYECRGENACRVFCAGLPDLGRVQRLVFEESAWEPKTLVLTATHDFGVATMIVRGEFRCRFDNLVPVR